VLEAGLDGANLRLVPRRDQPLTGERESFAPGALDPVAERNG
jgi:hypothetical protein